MSNPKFRIAICGGGVGGLTLAVALSRYQDIAIDVYEAARSFREIGAGIGVWPRVFRVLRKFGPDFEQQLLQHCDCEYTEEYVSSIKNRKSDQVVGTELFDLMSKGKLMRFHRADFHGVLLSVLPPSCTIHNAKRLVSYSQPLEDYSGKSPITLTFKDGSTAMCDVLIGADGIKSAVRPCMLRELAGGMDPDEKPSVLSCINPIWSGVTTYRTLIPAQKLRARFPDHRVLTEFTQYMGKNIYLLAYPVSLGQNINLVGYTFERDLVESAYKDDSEIPRPSFKWKANDEWVGELAAQQFVEPFKDLEEDAQHILECIEKGTLWAVHTVKNLPSTNFGRVAIMGDAAHAMVPCQGSGAGQSIEDAYLLMTVLGHKSTTLEMVPRALAIYDKLRRPFSSEVAQRSMRTGQLCTFQGDVPLNKLGDAITKSWEWAWLTDLDDALEEAVRLVEDSSIDIT
ncbi:salicylate hydroxylase [Suillus decipiens]|nr:salicylate hydroxylase [Suillus decipiens]